MKKIICIILALSLIFNIVLVYKHIENARNLNIAWSNSFDKLASRLVVARFNPEATVDVNKLSLDHIYGEKTSLDLLVAQLIHLQELPKGRQVVSANVIPKVLEVTNYERQILVKIENDINNSSKISSTDIEELVKIGKAWDKVLETLQGEAKKVDAFSPVFQGEQWKRVLDEATNELDGLEL